MQPVPGFVDVYSTRRPACSSTNIPAWNVVAVELGLCRIKRQAQVFRLWGFYSRTGTDRELALADVDCCRSGPPATTLTVPAMAAP